MSNQVIINSRISQSATVTFVNFGDNLTPGLSVSPQTANLPAGGSVTLTESSTNPNASPIFPFNINITLSSGGVLMETVTPGHTYQLVQGNIFVIFQEVTAGAILPTSGNNISIINTIEIDTNENNKCCHHRHQHDRRRHDHRRCRCNSKH